MNNYYGINLLSNNILGFDMSSRTRKIVALAQNQDNRYFTDLTDDKSECTVSSSDSSVLEIPENLRDVIDGIQVDSPRGKFTFIK